MGGTSPELLADRSVLSFVLPLLRADLRANEQAIEDAGRRLACPFTLFAWRRDAEIQVRSVWAWEDCTSGPARRVLLEGDHFALRSDPESVLREIKSDLERTTREHS